MTTLFTNPPMWETHPIADQPGKAHLRGGIRAGSRWPFTRLSPYLPDQFRFGSYLPTPFFLGSAAAYVEAAMPGSVVLRDSIARGESYQSFFTALARIKPDCLVLETGAAAWEHDLKLIKHIKLGYPQLRVAVAGPTVLTASKSTEAGWVDAWLVGEYEKNALKFVQGKNGLISFDLLTRKEMNEIPYPMYDEEVALNYWDACPKGQKAPHMQLLTSRGCPFRCCFCAWPATMTGQDPDGTQPRAVRFHSPEWVEGSIRAFLSRHTGTKSIYFDDDTFNLADKHTLEMCKVMQRVKLPWTAMCRADTVTRDTWMTMRDSGCVGVKIGFESGSQRVVDEIVNKKLNLKEAADTAIWLRQIGLSVHGTFTIGLPGENPEEVQMTHDFIADLYKRGGLDTHQLSGTATIEGTPLDAISQGTSLKAYPGAKNDRNFVVNHDGVKKVEEMK